MIKRKQKIKSNPNIQTTSRKKQNDSSNSETEESAVGVSYRSNRSAAPAGPADQGATAVIVSNWEMNINVVLIYWLAGNRYWER